MPPVTPRFLQIVTRSSPKSHTPPVSRCAPWFSLPQSCRGGIGKQYAVTRYRATFPAGKRRGCLLGVSPKPPERGLLKGKISQQEVPGYPPTCSALRAIAATANNPVKNE